MKASRPPFLLWFPWRFVLFGLCLAAFLFAVAHLGAQAMPPPADHYEVGVFRATDPIGPDATPFSRTIVTAEMVSCGHRLSDDPPDNVPNPTVLSWTDPADSSKECRVSAPTIVLSLPLGVGYRAAVRAVLPDGTGSVWSFKSNTFRRAPRGLPCPNGQPGIMVSGESDLNGKPVQVQLCINQ